MKIRSHASNALRITKIIFGSNAFLWFTIIFFIIEAAWVAFSFKYPMVFDERYHIGAIDYFTNHISPIALNQDPRYDTYGNMAFSNVSLYHYFMSLPYKFVKVITDNFALQIVFMRLLNVLLAALGLFMFSKLFRELKINKAISNLTIFFYSLLPLVILVAATVSYDNMLLPLTAYFFLIGVRILQKRQDISSSDYIKLIIIGIFASLVKFTFIPIFGIGLIYVGVNGYKKHNKQYLHLIFKDFKKNRSIKLYALLLICFLFIGLFSVRYIYPVIKYRTPLPDCKVLLPDERCMRGWVYNMTNQAIETKSTRTALPVQDYAQRWVMTINDGFDISAANTGSAIEIGKKMPIYAFLVTTILYSGVIILLYMWRSLFKSPGWDFSIILVLALTVAVFAFNTVSYYSANTDLNTQTRYLLSVLPIVMAMSMVALNQLLGVRPVLKIGLLAIVLLLSTQGAGDLKPILNGNDRWYWDNQIIINTNRSIKRFVSPFIEE